MPCCIKVKNVFYDDTKKFDPLEVYKLILFFIFGLFSETQQDLIFWIQTKYD